MSVRVEREPAADVFLPNPTHVNLFQDEADGIVKVKDSTGALTALGGGGGEPPEPQLSDEIVAALEGSATPLTAANPVVSVADLPVVPPVDLGPAGDITDAMVAGLASVTPLSSTNVVVSTADLPAPVDLGAAGDITDAMVAALAGSVTALSATNVVVSAAELAAATAPAATASALFMDLGNKDPSTAGVQAKAPKFGLRKTMLCPLQLWLKHGAGDKDWTLIGPR